MDHKKFKFTKDHEWLNIQEDLAIVGITDYAQSQLGDIVFIERNKKHKIQAIGNSMSIRMAVSREDVDHVYDIEDY